ncbi:hypothetical protein F3Y22_tig00110247pilonHSYRG00089 [Hibiscus syriacus]|uniref:Nucleoside phosphorylase domain-containing protein n=1 Tax=Hibiscus syriacus TaxID=106335 RepID=A0A6A3B897_HIBSY|nr:hypothetical protein F3Y22_tig00110247pilonHSYRG00089 [Hibiscus syriacus]
MGLSLEMVLFVHILVVLGTVINGVDGLVPSTLWKIDRINMEGPYLGIIVPNAFEMNPLLQSGTFVPDHKLPYLDFSGNANPKLQIGDVTIPQFWAHTGLWNGQRYGDGPEDGLALESNGDHTREIGYLRVSDYNSSTQCNISSENLLNNVWYQPEEIFPVDGDPELRRHAFWVLVNHLYLAIAEIKAKCINKKRVNRFRFNVLKINQGLRLGGCVNGTCLPRPEMVVRVERGISSNMFVDNRAYREFFNSKFNATAIHMERAAVALVCHQQNMPFIAFRSLSDLAGGGSALSNEASLFAALAAQNAVDVLIGFTSLLSS